MNPTSRFPAKDKSMYIPAVRVQVVGNVHKHCIITLNSQTSQFLPSFPISLKFFSCFFLVIPFCALSHTVFPYLVGLHTSQKVTGLPIPLPFPFVGYPRPALSRTAPLIARTARHSPTERSHALPALRLLFILRIDGNLLCRLNLPFAKRVVLKGASMPAHPGPRPRVYCGRRTKRRVAYHGDVVWQPSLETRPEALCDCQ